MIDAPGHEPSDEQLLERFRVDRDVAAFGTLFGRHIEELRNIARASLGHAADADDVVQNTFVQVFQSAHSFDARAMFRPWLRGILANQIRMALRSDRIRRLRPEKLRHDRDEAASALVEALDGELRRELQSAVARLPRPYREVVSLRFESGEQTHGIATRLGREPGTVRKQIARGLRLLRSVLPVGLAGGLVVWLTSLRAKAATTAPRSLRVAGAILVAAAVSWLLLPRAFPPHDATLATDAIRTQSSRAVVRETTGGRTAGRATLLGNATHGADLGFDVIHADGAPARSIELRVFRSIDGPVQLGQVRAKRVRTDDSGRVALGLEDDDYYLAAAGGMPRRLFRVRGGSSRTRSLRIGPRRALRGRVETPTGLRVAGASVHVSTTGGRLDAGDCVARTDPNGRFQTTLGCQEPHVWVTAPGYGASRVRVLQRAANGAPLRFVLEPPGARVSGRVRGAAGQPIPQAVVAWFPQATERDRLAPCYAKTDADGHFVLASVPVRKGALVVSALGHATKTRVLTPQPLEERFENFALDRGVELAGMVVDSNDLPVPAMRLIVGRPRLGDELADGGLRTRLVSTDAAGRFSVDRLAAGELFVFGLGRGRTPLRVKRFLRVPHATDVELRARALRTLAGRVIGSDGRGISGLRVTAMGMRGADPALLQRWLMIGRTGAGGRFRLAATRPGPYRIAVFAPGRDHSDASRQPLTVLTDVLSGDRPVLRVPNPERSTIRVHGQVLLDRVPRRDEVRLTVEHEHWPHARTVALDSDGRFELAAVPAGGYRFTLSHPRFGTRTLPVVRIAQVVDAYRVPPFVFLPPGELVVRFDGDQATGVRAVLHDARGRFVHRASAPGNRAVFPAVAPGRYRLSVSARALAPRAFDIEVAGGVREVVVPSLPATRCSLHVDFHSEGSLGAARGLVHVRVHDTADPGNATVFDDLVEVGADDFVRVEIGLTRGRYRVDAVCPSGRRTQRSFEVGARPCTIVAALR